MTEKDLIKPEDIVKAEDTRPVASQRSYGVWAMIILLWLALGALAFWVWSGSALVPADNQEEHWQSTIAGLSQRLQIAEAKLSNLQDGGIDSQAGLPIASSNKAAADNSAITERLTEMEALIATLREMEQRVASSERKAMAVVTEIEAGGSLLPAMFDAVTLRQKIHEGDYFAPQLEALRAQLQGNEELQRMFTLLEPLSQQGVFSLAQLQENFTTLADNASAKVDTNVSGIGEKIQAAVANVITIRKVDAKEGNTPDAIYVRAEQALEEGDIGRAMRELEALPAYKKEVFASWMEDAGKTLTVQRASKDIIEALNRLVQSRKKNLSPDA